MDCKEIECESPGTEDREHGGFTHCLTPTINRPHFTRYDVPPHMILDSVVADALWPKYHEAEWAEGIEWQPVPEDDIESDYLKRISIPSYQLKEEDILAAESAKIMGTSPSGFRKAADKHGLTVRTENIDCNGWGRRPTSVFVRKEVEALAKIGWRR